MSDELKIALVILVLYYVQKQKRPALPSPTWRPA